MFKKLLVIISTLFLLVGCTPDGDDVQTESSESVTQVESKKGSKDLIEDLMKEDLSDLSAPFMFTDGVYRDSHGYITYGDEENWINISGISNDGNTIFVIFNGMIVDDIEIDDNGMFNYHSAASDSPVELIFTSDSGYTVGDKISKNRLTEYEDLFFIPNEETIVADTSSEESRAIESLAYGLGDTIAYDDSMGGTINVTVNSYEQYWGDNYHTPEGLYFVKVDFTVENLSSESVRFSAIEFSLYDGNDEKAESISKDYFSEDIMPGKKASGSVYFDVKHDGPFETYVADGFWSGNF